MKILFLTEQEYLPFIERNEGYIFKNIRFNESLNQSEAFLGQAPIKSLEKKIYEVWVSDEPVLATIKDGMLIFETKGLYYARFESLEENSLEETTYNIYSRIFSLAKKMNARIARVWNYVPKILDENGEIERYRQFNIGRSNAWDELGPKNNLGQKLVSAATGIGVLGGGLRVGVIFSKNKLIHIQNPRQTNAFEYSSKYGPKPPMFSRATYIEDMGIFVSGTASILSEDVVHIGDLEKQIKETIENIKILVSNENLLRYDINEKDIFSKITGWRIYIKDKSKKDFVLEQFKKESDILADEILLHDNICRKDLLIEIECNYLK